MPPRLLATLPDLFGRLRFALAFVLLLLAFLGTRTEFLMVLIAALTLDAVDGPIARYLHQQSERGARLDSVADFSVYMALVVGAWQLWPQVFDAERMYIGIAASSMLLPLLVALLKFHTYTSYHTWLVKFATVCMAAGTLLVLSGTAVLPFRIASIISALAGLEQILITLWLEQPEPDVRHLMAARRRKKSAMEERDPG